jgi:hypothetical protein
LFSYCHDNRLLGAGKIDAVASQKSHVAVHVHVLIIVYCSIVCKLAGVSGFVGGTGSWGGGKSDR